jgi:hypothetical protein
MVDMQGSSGRRRRSSACTRDREEMVFYRGEFVVEKGSRWSSTTGGRGMGGGAVAMCVQAVANGRRRRDHPTGGGVLRGTVQGTHLRHAQEPRRGAWTAGRQRARTTRYGSGLTSRVGRRRAQVRVPAPKQFGLARFDQVYLKNFELECTNMITQKL